MSDAPFYTPHDGPPWQLHDPIDLSDIEQARPNLQHSTAQPQEEHTQPMQDSFLGIEQAASEASSLWTGTRLTFDTPHSRALFDHDPKIASSPSQTTLGRSPYSASPSSKTLGRVNPHFASQSRSPAAQNQENAYSASSVATRPTAPDAFSQPRPVTTLSSSKGKTRELPKVIEPPMPPFHTPFPLDPNTNLDPSQLLSSIPALGSTSSRRASAIGHPEDGSHGPLRPYSQSQISPSPRTLTRMRGTPPSGSRRMQGSQVHSASPSGHAKRNIHTHSRGDTKMQLRNNVPSPTHVEALPSKMELANTIFEHHMQNFAAENQIREENIAADVVMDFKRRANTEASQILDLPPLDVSSDYTPPQQQHQRNQNVHINQTAHGKMQVDSEGSHAMAKTHQVGSGPDKGSDGTHSTLNEPDIRGKLAKSRLTKIVTDMNITYAQRVVNDLKFQHLYAVGTQNLVSALFNVLAIATGLSELIVHVWAAKDIQLLELVRTVSPQLKSRLPVLRNAIRSYLEHVANRELRWVAASKTTTMFYDSFSGLKAALKERDRRRGDRQSILIDALGVDRSHVWNVLQPDPDDELDARMAGEMADAQARTTSGTRASLKELDELEDQYLEELGKG